MLVIHIHIGYRKKNTKQGQQRPASNEERKVVGLIFKEPVNKPRKIEPRGNARTDHLSSI